MDAGTTVFPNGQSAIRRPARNKIADVAEGPAAELTRADPVQAAPARAVASLPG